MGLTADHKAKISKALKKYHACARKHACGKQKVKPKVKTKASKRTTATKMTKQTKMTTRTNRAREQIASKRTTATKMTKRDPRSDKPEKLPRARYNLSNEERKKLLTRARAEAKGRRAMTPAERREDNQMKRVIRKNYRLRKIAQKAKEKGVKLPKGWWKDTKFKEPWKK